MSEPTLADLYMAIRALEYAVGQTSGDLDQELDDLRDALGLDKANFKTRFGMVVGTTTKEKFTIAQDDRVVAYALANFPHEVIPAYSETITIDHPATVHATLQKTLEGRAKVIDGKVFDKVTGEELTFVNYTPEKKGWRADLTREAKANAVEVMRGRLGEILALLEDSRQEIEA